jgi:predicted Zn-dependent protease with MMP-like domain
MAMPSRPGSGRRAARDRADGPPPSADDIERLGLAVLAELPEPFRGHVGGVVIRVQDFADDATLEEMAIESPFDLLGLYHGVPVGHDSSFAAPRQDVDMIFLYRRALLDYWCETGLALTDIVRNTLIHEIGHHFGYSDDDMDAIEFGEE